MWCFRDRNSLRMSDSMAGPRTVIPLRPRAVFKAPPSAGREIALPMTEPSSTSGASRRILIVEDDALLAMALEDSLTSLGHHVVGPARQIAEALRLAQTEILDGAVLDLNIGGSPIDPVAKVLEERSVPFAFSTGYSHNKVPPKWRNRPMLQKPYHPAELEHVVATAFQAKGGSAP